MYAGDVSSHYGSARKCRPTGFPSGHRITGAKNQACIRSKPTAQTQKFVSLNLSPAAVNNAGTLRCTAIMWHTGLSCRQQPATSADEASV